jgi:hypothetical protein
MSIRFRSQRDSIPVLHQSIGLNYLQVMVLLGIGSLTREVMAQYNAEQVYSTSRGDATALAVHEFEGRRNRRRM